MKPRKIYPIRIGRCGKYKYFSTSGHDTGVTIFIKKRLLGFLWWVFVKDMNGCPITYNKFDAASAFMNGDIKYNDMLSYSYSIISGEKQIKTTVRPMTDEIAWNDISKRIETKTGEIPELDCVKKAWEFDGRRYIHVATEYALLWHYIFKSNGKKLWQN